jgi:hypothetical protein
MNQYERLLIAKAERFKRRPCAHCGADVASIQMYRTVKRSGDSQYYWFCMACNRRAAAGAGENIGYELLDFWIAHGKFPGITDKEQFPILYIYTGEPCAVRGCNDTETQEHHWAPRILSPAFGPDWNNWPTVYLCAYHHRQWHEIVTPYIEGFKQRHEDFETMFRESVGL